MKIRFVIDLFLDGYETEDEMRKAGTEFLEESLDFSASSVHVVSGQIFTCPDCGYNVMARELQPEKEDE